MVDRHDDQWDEKNLMIEQDCSTRRQQKDFSQSSSSYQDACQDDAFALGGYSIPEQASAIMEEPQAKSVVGPAKESKVSFDKIEIRGA